MNKYNKIMDHITVSDQMKSRILQNISSTDLREDKIIRFPDMRRIIALAASFAIIMVSAYALHQMNRQPVGDNPPSDTAGLETAGPAVEYTSARELSEASGITISELSNLPFTATETAYLDYKDNLVEISYSDGSQDLYYRVSKGSIDNSGDYNEYDNIFTEDINGIKAILKGSDDLIYLVLYEQDGYSYSISSSQGLTPQQVEKMILP
ncbi:MAG: hypothetical protein IKX76_01350 [Eubacterium sp.]|nr:hypothetical protein [Eubacterium sp.]